MGEERPRLIDGSSVRRHLIEGQEVVLLTEPERGVLIRLDERAWALLSLCDGRRDVDEVARLAHRAGVLSEREELDALLRDLAELGLVTHAPPEPLPMGRTPADRPLERFDGYSLVCDGSGSCCRIYGSIAFSAEEATEARRKEPSLGPLPIPLGRAFTPLIAGASGLSLALQDDRCLMLDDDSRCRLHRRAGLVAKPFGCRFFPANAIDDGVAVRVAPLVECACELDCLGREDGEPLAGDAVTRRDLPAGLYIPVVPETVELGGGRQARREALREWTQHVVATFGETDAIDATWRLARTVERVGLALDPDPSGPGPRPDDLRPWLAALGERMGEIAPTYATVRSPRSLARQALEHVARAIDELDLPAVLEPRVDPRERFSVRAALFGGRGVAHGMPLTEALDDMVVRLVVARAMTTVQPPKDAALREPLATLNVVMRNHGLDRYVGKITREG